MQCLSWNFASSPGAVQLRRRSREASLRRKMTTIYGTGRGNIYIYYTITKRVTVKRCSVNLTELLVTGRFGDRSLDDQLRRRCLQSNRPTDVGSFFIQRLRETTACDFQFPRFSRRSLISIVVTEPVNCFFSHSCPSVATRPFFLAFSRELFQNTEERLL